MESVDTGLVGKPPSAEQDEESSKTDVRQRQSAPRKLSPLKYITYDPVVHIEPDGLVVPDNPFRAMVDTESGSSDVRSGAQVGPQR